MQQVHVGHYTLVTQHLPLRATVVPLSQSRKLRISRRHIAVPTGTPDTVEHPPTYVRLATATSSKGAQASVSPKYFINTKACK